MFHFNILLFHNVHYTLKSGIIKYQKEGKMISKIIKKMVGFSNGNIHDINHFLKVYAYAKTIGETENLDSKTMFILETSAIIHDISCPLCREKYGNAKGTLQEKESAPLVLEFLKEFNLEDEIEKRILYLIEHHHTYNNIEGLDYQILIEADFLVNADEENYSKDKIKEFKNKIFKTKAGTTLLDTIYMLK